MFGPFKHSDGQTKYLEKMSANYQRCDRTRMNNKGLRHGTISPASEPKQFLLLQNEMDHFFITLFFADYHHVGSEVHCNTALHHHHLM